MRNINLRNLKQSLDHLCYCLNSLYDINYGGCCYVAYLIACHLDKLKVKYDLVIYDYDYPNKDKSMMNYEIRNMCVPNSVTGKYTSDHYCISIANAGTVNSIIVDFDDSNAKRYVIKDITSRNIKWLYRKGHWNDVYNHQNDKYVRGMINLFFSKYEQNNLSNH